MHNFYLISTPELLSNAVNLQTPKMLTRKIKLWDINAHITCRLCNGYLIDATTVTECLHTFCRSCLVKYLEENNTCPTCRIVIHQSHPLQYIGHDRTMQDIVYKLVPGLQEAEMKKQREFYHKLGMEVPGDIKGETCSAKQHLDSHRNGETKTDESSNKEASEEKQEEDNDYHRSDEQLDILCNEEILGKDHTLKFVVVTRWRFKKTSAMTQEMNQVEDFGADFDINLDSDLRWPDFSSCFLSSASQPALLRQADTYK
ncbi:PREDICTED: polycomb group RING finger protein 3 isoform X5 [Crocodylus porosus]|uniref:polycomb group RING finger protein 3 isoform X5 n=1 Tax=Crocodylus porosus TaxID=8502 RepID=UPI00093C4CBB|nr:PREDICTED: polycomb group RING finger protein 3 isoform X5 [Crocodylus porosus]